MLTLDEKYFVPSLTSGITPTFNQVRLTEL